MKHIYVDVSYFIGKEDKELWSRIASNLNMVCHEKYLISLICSDIKNEGFSILSRDASVDKIPDTIIKTIQFGNIEAGAVYFDIVYSVPKPLLSRNYLYKELKSSGVQIISFVASSVLDAILHPENYDDNEIMSAIDSLSAAVSYSSCVIVDDTDAINTFYLLCGEMDVSAPKCRLFCETNLTEFLCSFSKEEGSVQFSGVTQMVVLTARNDDIMKSLPYIEAFMPFIKELVVCCPSQNILPFREKYNGRLFLSFIADDELLNGESLPNDHQARNFFLRCKLIEQNVLKDIFIMTDDDYRPMHPITEEVFIKNGRYQAYYFYDLRDWQGTYNNYTSFDNGAFRTRDFLIDQGYKTLQYSSHQPQIIDKKIFREMLSVHKGIENNPYDEWSTYFNYGFYHYPDKFSPCESVSMCWPGDLASWDIHHVPDEYIFENYYEELYANGAIFKNFSDIYNENTLSENAVKADIYRRSALRQLREQEVFCSYQKEYSEKTGEYPSFVICHDDKNKIILHVPEYIKMAANSWTRVPVSIEKAVYDNAEDNTDFFISYHFISSLGLPILNSPELLIKSGDSRLMLPVRCPDSEIKNAYLMIRVILKEKYASERSSEKYISESSMKLMLININEVDYV